MNFNSIEFACFFILVLLLYVPFSKSIARRNLFLLVASYAFYASWNVYYSALIFMSSLVDYILGRTMADAEPRARRWMLSASLAYNLGVLCVFKYFNFFSSSMHSALSWFGVDVQLPYLNVLLPVGISFYTFQTLSYSIDVYRGSLRPEKKFINYALYVSFFPQLVAGPIIRASDLLPQFLRATRVDPGQLSVDLSLIFRGLTKKILIADMIATLGVDPVFSNPEAYSAAALWLGFYGYAIQIYCDFSGYSDVAIGVAGILGFRVPPNFNRPYWADSPRDFWRRWHISLSTWLRDYLYIPLGGNRVGRAETIRNVLITMGLGGLWHGAAWNFILWGIYHGGLLAVERLYWPLRGSQGPASMLVKRVLTFHLVCFGWLLFRIREVDTFSQFILGMFGSHGEKSVSLLFGALVACGLAAHFMPPRFISTAQRRFAQLPVTVQAMGYFSLLMAFAGLAPQGSQFIYFQF
jgi:D-alanyl-lipoteichoic acid acyltransferase DltB (MBOAT superfamily)